MPLNTVFEQQTHVKLTDAFDSGIIKPAGMGDFIAKEETTYFTYNNAGEPIKAVFP
jgi:hypothetical protein